jgi:hypothetical protein
MFDRLFGKKQEISPDALRKQKLLADMAKNAEEAAKDAELTGRRVFRLKHKKGEDDATRPLRFITVGCQGSGDKHQLEVARLMNELCADPATRPDFILILGDNVYDWGADSATDPNIRKCFDDIYLRPEFEHLRNMPFFFILGNHDGNLQNLSMARLHPGSGTMLNPESGIKRSMHEVAHSLVTDEKYDFEMKKHIYQMPALHLGELPAYNMPRRYYSLIAGETQIFCVDSSTYVKDYLDLAMNPNTMNATNNQAAWLAEEVASAKAAGRKIILAQHHPIYTPGKRAYHNDLGIYLSKPEIALLPQFFGMQAEETTPYNTFLTACLQQQQLEFDLTLAAHDHNMYYYNNKNDVDAEYKICQVTAGVGGGPLQERSKFTEQHNMGCFVKKHGLAVISHTPKADKFDITLHTSDHQHRFEFNTDSSEAILHFHPDNTETNAIKRFHRVVERAINEYLSFLGDKQEDRNGDFLKKTNNLSHGKEGAERAHTIWAHIKQAQVKPYTRIVHEIYELVRWQNRFTSPAPHSLITLLDKHMVAEYGYTIEEFVANIDNPSYDSGNEADSEMTPAPYDEIIATTTLLADYDIEFKPRF